MNFDPDNHRQQPPQADKKSAVTFLLKLIGAGILLFLLLFVMNKTIKNTITLSLEQHRILQK